MIESITIPPYILTITLFQIIACYITYHIARRNLEYRPIIWGLTAIIIPAFILWIWLYIRKRKRISYK